jgi:hypothetical protein
MAMRFIRPLLLAGLMFASTTLTLAQELEQPQPPMPQAGTEPFAATPYVQPVAPSYETTPPRTIHQQNAIARGQQRQARMASMAWYGMSNSRPVATASPFATMYSPAWQMPGGRPFAWHHYLAWPTTYVYYR